MITNIPKGATAVITVKALATEFGTQLNNLTIVYPDGHNDTVNCTIYVDGVDLAVVKTVDNATHFVNDTVVWTITVSNADNATTATNVVLDDLLPAGFTFINSTAGSAYDSVSGVWTIGTLAPGASTTLVIYSHADTNGTFTNEANVSCIEPEWNYGNNYDNATVVISQTPNHNKTANETRTLRNKTVEYYLTVTNVGEAMFIKNITLIDDLPAGVDYIETISVDNAKVVSNATLSNNNKTITWVITNIPKGATAVITVKALATEFGTQLNNLTIVYPDGHNDTVNCTIYVDGVDLAVVKTVDNATHFVNDTVVWTIVVSNAPNATTATNVALKDLLPTGFALINSTAGNDYSNGIWNIGTLAPGEVKNLIIYSRATAEGNFTNEANVTCKEPEWNYTNNYDNATATVSLLPPPIKVVNNTKPFYHENVTYNLTVVNNADYMFIKNVTVYDMLPDGLEFLETIDIINADVVVNTTVNSKNNISWVIKNIPAHSTAIIMVKVKVNAVGNLTNNETIVYPDGSNKTVNCTIDVQPIVDVSLVKTAEKGVYFVGDVVVWTIKVANAFNGSAATNVKMNDVLPSQFTLINYTATKGTYANGVWTIGTMANGTEETLTIYSRAIVKGNYTNYANVTCNETEWNYTNNFDNATVKVNKNPDINKTVNDTTPFTHEFVEYYLTVDNTGDIDYTNNLTVIDSLPNGLVYANEYKVDGAKLVKFVADGQKLYWTITNISANSSAVITVKILADKAGDLVNNGTLVPPYGNNITVNCTITPIPRADLEIVKLVSQKVSHYNDRVIWTLIVKNNGPDTAENAVVSDKLPAGIVYVSDDSKGAYNHKTGIWKLGDLPVGQSRILNIVTTVKVTNRTVINFANVSSDTPDPNMTNNKCNNSTTVPPEADLVLTKDVNNKRVTVGDKVTFTIVVSNLGPDTAVNTRAYDVLPDGLKLISFKVSRGSYDPETGIWTIGDMKMGERASLTIVAEALITGVIVNEAYVESDTYDPNMTNNYDNATVVVVGPPHYPPHLHETGNPIVMVLLSLLAMVGVTLRRRN